MKYISVAETSEKMEYLRAKCAELLCPGTCTGCFSYRKDLEHSGECEKPERANKRVKSPRTLLDILQEEKAKKYSGGIYHKTQIELTYNSNHMEGSKLTHDQTSIFLRQIRLVWKMKFSM